MIVVVLIALSIMIVLLTMVYWWWFSPSEKLDPKDKAVLVTGCDTGFGFEIAQRLDFLGCQVFAGCLDAHGEGAWKLVKGASDKLTVLQMDVTKDKEVCKALETVQKNLQYPEKGLWGVVNNAGLANYGLIEWCSMEDYQRVIDVNFFGGVRVIKTFLPLIRKAKGRVVNTISILGRKATLGRSCYVSSKHAMEGFTQCLRLEMKEWNVHVSIIEPGNFVSATGIFTREKVLDLASKMWDKMPETVRRDYGRDSFDDYVKWMENFVTGGCSEMTPVISCIERALFETKPRLRYCPKSFDEHVLSFVMTHFPHEVADFIYKI